MNIEDMIRLAHEAGWQYADGDSGYDPLWRFAKLVAAAKEEQMKQDGWRQCAAGQRTTQFCGQLHQSVEAEREACAKVAETVVPRHTECGNKIAATIRARGE